MNLKADCRLPALAACLLVGACSSGPSSDLFAGGEGASAGASGSGGVKPDGGGGSPGGAAGSTANGGTGGASTGGAGGNGGAQGGEGGTGGAQGGASGNGGSVAGSGGSVAGSGGSPPDAGADGPVDDCVDSARVIYLLSQEGGLYSFDPKISGLGAYKSIGSVTCSSTASPQTMTVDRAANAYVFYSSGEMFLLSTSNASCSKINAYVHPASGTQYQMGMGITASSPGSSGQVWYAQSPDFGLATIDLQTLQVTKKNVFVGALAELSGGPDAKLFRFDASTAQLSEINLSNFQLTLLRTFSFASVTAWAMARHSGAFYLFTAESPDPYNPSPSKTTVWDPKSNQESVRDANVGFTVVGAGQSTCVPAL